MEEHYISGEAHHKQLQEQRSAAQSNKARQPLIWAAIAVIAVLISGLGIFMYSKHTSHIPPEGSSQLSFSSNGAACGNGDQCFTGNGPTACTGSGPCSQSNRPSPPPIGTLTAVSASSITEQLQDGTTKTFAITNNTQIGIGPGAPNKPYGPNYRNYIHVGEEAGIMADPSNSSQAQMVMPFAATQVNTN